MEIHKAAMNFLAQGCSKKPSMMWPRIESDIFGFCAREKGIDSIQFAPQEGVNFTGTFGVPGLFEMVFSNLQGDKDCAVDNVNEIYINESSEYESDLKGLKEGWKASRPCNCTNHAINDECGIVPVPPWPLDWIGTDPPVCKIQKHHHFWQRWPKCKLEKCRVTACLGQNVGRDRAKSQTASLYSRGMGVVGGLAEGVAINIEPHPERELEDNYESNYDTVKTSLMTSSFGEDSIILM